MMFKNPQHWHNFIYLAAWGVGYRMAYKLPYYEADIAGIVLMVGSLVFVTAHEIGSVYVLKNQNASLSIIDNRQAELDALATARANAPKEHIQTPRINVFKQGQAFPQLVAAPQIDQERVVARTLNDQRLGGLKMDISETFWIRGKRWKGNRDSFVAFRWKWEYYKIAGKKGSGTNSQYEIFNARAVELIANGKLVLPPPPQ